MSIDFSRPPRGGRGLGDPARGDPGDGGVDLPGVSFRTESGFSPLRAACRAPTCPQRRGPRDSSSRGASHPRTGRPSTRSAPDRSGTQTRSPMNRTAGTGHPAPGSGIYRTERANASAASLLALGPELIRGASGSRLYTTGLQPAGRKTPLVRISAAEDPHAPGTSDRKRRVFATQNQISLLTPQSYHR